MIRAAAIRMEDALKYLYKVQKEVYLLQSIEGLLEWDEGTNMPKAGYGSRSEHQRIIQGLIQEKLVNRKLEAAISALKSGKLSKRDSIVLEAVEKQVRRIKYIPVSFVRQLSKRQVIAKSAWKEAYKKNDFSIALPDFSRMVELKRQQAGYFSPESMPYDSLLNEYEEGMNSERLSGMFRQLKEELSVLLGEIRKSQAYSKESRMDVKMSRKEQKAIIIDFLRRMGISSEKVKLGASSHPFTSVISGSDIRITASFKEPLESFFSALHEAGHALYAMNLPQNYNYTVIYNAASYGLDEGMALIWENMIGRSKEFWKSYYIAFRKNTKGVQNWKEFYESINRVRSSPVRISADEVTYCLHVILRFELERDLVNGTLKPAHVRDAWNQKMGEYLGIIPKNDREGLLQDDHWASGEFGYFPTYALGMVYSAQVFRKIAEDIPSAGEDISAQEFSKVIEWLTAKIYSKGNSGTAESIVRSATGLPANPNIFIEYLRKKYLEIYR